MRITEIITELFSPNYKPSEDNHWRLTANTRSDIFYRFDVKEKQYEVNLINMLGAVNNQIYRVEFGLIGNYGLRSWNIANTGHSQQVFELVAYSLRHAVYTQDINGYYFTADEPSRQKLYSALARRMAAELEWDLRPDLGQWLDRTSAQCYLVIVPELAEILDREREEEANRS
jgi:hypothetical protein